MPDRSQAYDAFLSYAHENVETVMWLQRFLERYRVPGVPRRSIFVDRRNLTSSVLDAAILGALENSRFLVVCCSRAALESKWVAKEVEAFLETHGPEAVLPCLVGDREETLHIPGAVRGVEAAIGGELFKPDLRGRPQEARGNKAIQVRDEALGMLAPIVGLSDKSSILASVTRRRQRLLALAGGIAVVAAAVVAGRQAWLGTSAGFEYRLVQRLLDGAEGVMEDDPDRSSTARALARLGREEDLRDFAEFVEYQPFRALVLADGLAALPTPACEEANSVLEAVSFSETAAWPEIYVRVQAACGGSWIPDELSEPEDESGLADRALRFAQGGLWARAEPLLAHPDFPAEGRLEAQVAGALARGRPLTLDAYTLASWTFPRDPGSVIYDGLELLKALDAENRANDSGMVSLLDAVANAYLKLETDEARSWNDGQLLAALLAGQGDQIRAASLLELEPPGWADWGETGPETGDPGQAAGWAWRGLAYQRLGLPDEALEAFRKAEWHGLAQIPATRTWFEWEDVIQAYAAAGLWELGLEAAQKPGGVGLRFSLVCELLAHWAGGYGVGSSSRGAGRFR